MSKSKNLHKAKKEKNDEFYTQLTDIEKELQHYSGKFKDKIVYCNCDDPRFSNFWNYFSENFDTLGLKKLVATYINLDFFGKSECWIKTKDDLIVYQLSGNGDFRSPECLEILAECDIVVTNPPFSLFREYIATLAEYDKKFLVIGNFNSIICKEIFPLIKDNKIWLGYSPRGMNFDTPTGQNGVNACWFTNLEYSKRFEEMILWNTYSPEKFEKYDNYDAINIDKTSDIPKDYDGYMGVPITFLDKYNPNQFEIIGIMNTGEKNEGIRYENSLHGRPVVNGKEKYLRIIVKLKNPQK